jgi:hypothetical protein
MRNDCRPSAHAGLAEGRRALGKGSSGGVVGEDGVHHGVRRHRQERQPERQGQPEPYPELGREGQNRQDKAGHNAVDPQGQGEGVRQLLFGGGHAVLLCQAGGRGSGTECSLPLAQLQPGCTCRREPTVASLTEVGCALG